MKFNRRRRVVVVGCDHLVDLFPDPRGPVVSDADDARRLHSWLREEAEAAKMRIRALAMWTHRVLIITRPAHLRSHQTGLGHTKLRHTGWINWSRARDGSFSGRYHGHAFHESRADDIRRFLATGGGDEPASAALPDWRCGGDRAPTPEVRAEIERHLIRGWPLGPPEFVAEAVSLSLAAATTDQRTAFVPP